MQNSKDHFSSLITLTRQFAQQLEPLCLRSKGPVLKASFIDKPVQPLVNATQETFKEEIKATPKSATPLELMEIKLRRLLPNLGWTSQRPSDELARCKRYAWQQLARPVHVLVLALHKEHFAILDAMAKAIDLHLLATQCWLLSAQDVLTERLKESTLRWLIVDERYLSQIPPSHFTVIGVDTMRLMRDSSYKKQIWDSLKTRLK